MNPYINWAIAEQRSADLRRNAEAQRRARTGRASGTGSGQGRRGWLARRRYRQVELTWPDGVCTVVPAQAATAPAEQQRRWLTGTRR